jgi:hypothetical protein
MGKVEIGDMVELTDFSKEYHIKYAFSAWKSINENKLGFNGNVPEDSSEYKEWFSKLCNSIGYVVDTKQINVKWAKVRFMCCEEPFWLQAKHLKKCR